METLENTETFSPTETESRQIPTKKVVPKSAKFSASRIELVTAELSSEEKPTTVDKQKANIEQSSNTAIQKTVQLTQDSKFFSYHKRPSLPTFLRYKIQLNSRDLVPLGLVPYFY